MARVDALLRRSGAARPPETQETFAIGAWQVDPASLRAEREDEVAEFTRREMDLLSLFAREAGRIVSRRRLLQEVWGFPDPDRVETRTVDMHVAKLRKKLTGALFETVRGEGYRLVG